VTAGVEEEQVMKAKWQVTTVVVSVLLSIGSTGAEVPERSLGGQTLEVPEEHLDLGEVYYLHPGGDPQLILSSDALLQRLRITTRRAVGYVVTPFDLEEEGVVPILGGAFRIPVASLKTGLDDTFNTPGGGDRVLRGSEFLDLEGYPEIFFEITGVSDISRTLDSEEMVQFSLELAGKLTVKANTSELKFPATVTFMPSTFCTLARLEGDLMWLAGSFNLRPPDFAWEIPSPDFSDRIADELQADVYLFMSTVSPDRSIDPRDDPTLYAKQKRLLTLLRDLEDPDAAYGFGYALMEEVWDEPEELHRLARTVLTTPGITWRNLPFAMKAVGRSNELTEEKDAHVLATLARAHFEMGDLESAVRQQTKAKEIAGSEGRLAERIAEDLARYEREAKRAAQ
jgi:hypothetical protein